MGEFPPLFFEESAFSTGLFTSNLPTVIRLRFSYQMKQAQINLCTIVFDLKKKKVYYKTLKENPSKNWMVFLDTCITLCTDFLIYNLKS